jgi:hypothetical protein
MLKFLTERLARAIRHKDFGGWILQELVNGKWKQVEEIISADKRVTGSAKQIQAGTAGD